MNLIEAFQKVWSRIYSPTTTCPDIQIWDVREVLTEILVEEEYPLFGPKPIRYVYASLCISPLSADVLCMVWSNANHLAEEPPTDHTAPDYMAKTEEYWAKADAAEDLRSNEVIEALRVLVEANKVTLDQDTQLYSIVG